MRDFNDIIDEVWPRVRKRHLFPELPRPACAEAGSHVALDIRKKRITISGPFVESLSAELDPEITVEALLDHAVSHYLYCPWNFAHHLRLYAGAKSVLKDGLLARRAADAFMDVAADIHCVARTNSPLPLLYPHLDRTPLVRALHAAYQQVWDLDLGVKDSDDVSVRLSRLPYLDRSRWEESVKRFALLVRDLLEEEAAEGRIRIPCAMGRHEFYRYSDVEIQQGLKDLAMEAEKPCDFAELIEDFQDEISKAAGHGLGGAGIGPGSPADADTLYYMKLAEHYLLPIRKTPREKDGSTYPHHHASWEAGQPYQDIDPWTSFGKVMPGISQVWKRTEAAVAGREEKTPDCLIVIDSSASMKNPRHSLSHAVLGAACACNAYLKNRAEVAVYNFSDAVAGDRRLLSYCRSKSAIYQTVCHYFGGGTRLVIEDIETLQMERTPDIFLITDMQITNLQSLIGYFNTCRNRVTAVHIGNNTHVRRFRDSLKPHGHIDIYAVEKRADIPRIVLGKVREYLYDSERAQIRRDETS